MPFTPPKGPAEPLTIEDLIDAFNEIKSQGPIPDTIVMSPQQWEEIKNEIKLEGTPVVAKTYPIQEIKLWDPSYGISIEDIVASQSMTEPSDILAGYAKEAAKKLAEHKDKQIFEMLMKERGLLLKEESLSQDRWEQIAEELYGITSNKT
jgi:hypothetical protein